MFGGSAIAEDVQVETGTKRKVGGGNSTWGPKVCTQVNDWLRSQIANEDTIDHGLLSLEGTTYEISRVQIVVVAASFIP